MTALAQGVLSHHLPWHEIGVGAAIALICIIVDEKLKTKGLRLPILAVGLGIYLPPEVIVPTVTGGFINLFAKWTIKRRHASKDKSVMNGAFENGVLIA